jgi:hypothetical protein
MFMVPKSSLAAQTRSLGPVSAISQPVHFFAGDAPLFLLSLYLKEPECGAGGNVGQSF